MIRPGARSALRLLLRVEDGEVAALLLSCACSFFLLAGYYVIRPLRETMGTVGQVNDLTFLYAGSLGGTFLATPLVGLLVARHPRRRFLPFLYHFFVANLLLFYALFQVGGGGAGGAGGGGSALAERLWVARAFYVWTSVFNLLAVSMFWGLMADIFHSDQGKRLFPIIGVGGTLGAIAGPAVTALLARRVGAVNLLLLSAALLEVVVLCVRALCRRLDVDAGAVERAAASGGELARGGALGGVTATARSPYLLGLGLYLLLFTLPSTFLYFDQARLVKATIADDAGRTAWFAAVDSGANAVALLFQLLLSGRLLARFGVAPVLLVLPTVTLLGFAGRLPFSHLTLLGGFQALRRGLEYGLARPAREVLFTVLRRDEKYKAKSFLDTFVYRGGDLLASLLERLVRAPAARSGVVGVVCVAWAAVSWTLGRAQAARARRAEASRT